MRRVPCSVASLLPGGEGGAHQEELDGPREDVHLQEAGRRRPGTQGRGGEALVPRWENEGLGTVSPSEMKKGCFEANHSPTQGAGCGI